MKSEFEIGQLIDYTLRSTAHTKPLFKDRTDAGEQLTELILRQDYINPVFIAVPMGGIPVALPIRERFSERLYFSFAAKIPFSRDCDHRFGMGAVAPGMVFLNDEVVEVLKISNGNFSPDEGIKRAQEKLGKTMEGLRDYTLPLPDLEGKTAVIIDDGLATGYTALAAALSLRPLNPRHVVVASPVGSSESCKLLEKDGIECVVCYLRDEPAILIDRFYSSFQKVTGIDIIRLLGERLL